MLGALSRSILTLCCTESCSKERIGCGRFGRWGIDTGLGSARTRTSRQVALQVGSVCTGGLKSFKDNHQNISERNEHAVETTHWRRTRALWRSKSCQIGRLRFVRINQRMRTPSRWEDTLNDAVEKLFEWLFTIQVFFSYQYLTSVRKDFGRVLMFQS